MFKFNIRSYIFIIIFFIGVFFSIKNTYIVNSHFFLENVSIREAFFYENKVNFKGTHEPGERYFSILSNNITNIKNFDIKKIKSTFKKIKDLDIKSTDYFLEYKLVKLLQELSNLPNTEKKLTAIYVPKSITTYLNISCDTHMIPFIVPAISNIAMIDGLPLKNKSSCFGHKNEYGYLRYNAYNKKANLFHLKPSQLCDKAVDEGLKKVIELVKLDSDFKTKVYICE